MATAGVLALCVCCLKPGLGAESKAPAVPPLPAGPAFGVNTARSLRLAIEDLIATSGAKYPNGKGYLARLEAIEKAGETPENAAALAQLRREALLANPLLDFDRLLLVRRKKHNGMFVNGSARWYPRDGFEDEIAILSPVRPEGTLTTLWRPQGAVFAGELDLHWDAQRLLFTSMGTKNCFHLFEMNLATKDVRQLTPVSHSDIDYYDPCYLPNGDLLFTSTANYQSTPCNRVGKTETLCLMDTRGGIRRLTFDQEYNWFPKVMNDGRVMYMRWEYCDLPHAFSGVLFNMNPDGTRQRELYGSGCYWPNRIFHARPIPNHPTKVVGIVHGHHDVGTFGNLVVFDPSRGHFETEGAVHVFPGYGKKAQPVYADWLNQVAPWARFIHPWPLSEKHFLVSAQMPTQPNGTGYQGSFGIYLVDVFDNIVPLCVQPGANLFEPIPLRPRPVPPVVPDQVDLSRTDGLVYLQDVYAGAGLRGIPRGVVKRLRLFTYHYCYRGIGGQWDRVGLDGPWEPKRVLGTVPVAADGSAFFRVPANTPISVQPLDADGKALQLMRSWFTAMPGERVSCVGCHETQLTTPPSGPAAFPQRPPSEIEPWHGPTRGFSFAREVQPILDQYCVGCHNGGKQSAGGKEQSAGDGGKTSEPKGPSPDSVPDNRKPTTDNPAAASASVPQHLTPNTQHPAPPDLRAAPPEVKPPEFCVGNFMTLPAKFSPSYRALMPFVRNASLEPDRAMLMPCEFHADTTVLVQMLRKGHHGVKLSAEAFDRLYTWIDLNCPAYGTWHEAVVHVAPEGILKQRDRRRELLRLYAVGRDEDPEAIYPVSYAPAEKGSVPRAASRVTGEATKPEDKTSGPPAAASNSVPQHPTPDTQHPTVPSWPFDAAEAKRRQAAAGPASKTLDLGRGVKLELVRIPAGEFLMGDAAGEADEQPAARVAVGTFWMGRFEVTNQQFRLFDPTHDSRLERVGALHFSMERRGAPMNGPLQPVVRVSWLEAIAFCRWLSQKAGEFFTLPSEAQWEYACRAGTGGDFACDLPRPREYHPQDTHTWAKPPNMSTWTPYSHDVGQGTANAWGLADMHANVAEWTVSAYRPYPYRDDDGRNAGTADCRLPIADLTAKSETGNRESAITQRFVVRGGSFRDSPRRCRSAFRLDYPSWQKVFNVGFRVVSPAGQPLRK